MDIEYKMAGYRREDTVTDSVDNWLACRLREGGIELQLSKLQQLLSLIGSQWLQEHQNRLGEVVDVVECDGHGHILVDNE
jgi:hypothetical protein